MNTLNRLYNCKNPYQGYNKRVLCVCSAGLLRSPTTAVVLAKEYGHNTRACGLETSYALIPFDVVLATWAHEIVCMNNNQKAEIEVFLAKNSIEPKPIKVLNINDSYEYMDSELVQLILERYNNE